MQVDEESSDSDEEVRRNPWFYFFLTRYRNQEEEFYTPGSLELLDARRHIAEYSLPRLDLPR
jgi:U4/U6 small nuclear ribonucleoprotein PRP4